MLHSKINAILVRDLFQKFFKMEKIEYRAYIKTRALLGISATEISNELEQVHGDQAPKYRTVSKLVALFKKVRESLEDDPRPGCKLTRI